MPAPISKRDLLIDQANELIKQYIAYDSQNRMEYVYTVPTDAIDGAKCTRVQYVYRDATSTQVMKMRETNDLWVSATMDV